MALIQIADEVYRKYASPVGPEPRASVEKRIERQLARFADLPVGTRALGLPADVLVELEILLGLGATKDPQSLLAAVRGWAGISIGDIRLDFSPAQLAEIAHRAEKQGKTPQAVVEDIVAQMNQNFFMDAVVAR